MLKLLGEVHRSHSERALFLRFALVGLSISVVDIAVLDLLMALRVNIYLARVLSYSSSMMVGYLLNRCFTFHHLETGRALWHSLLRYLSVHSTGGVIKFGNLQPSPPARPATGRRARKLPATTCHRRRHRRCGRHVLQFIFLKKLVFDS